MKNISIKELVKIAIVLYFIVVTLLFLFIANKSLKNQNTDIKIKKETLLGNLLFQYNTDMQDCIANSKLSEAECIKIVNESNLGKKIQEWGGAEYLIQQ